MTRALLSPGMRVARRGGVPGTLGTLVRHVDGRPCLLTSAHVLVAAGAARGQEVVIPADTGASNAVPVARLEEWTDLSTLQALADAAIAVLDPDVRYAMGVPQVGLSTGAGGVPAKGEYVQFYGATTRYGRGVVVEPEAGVRYEVLLPDGGRARVAFEDVVMCTRFTNGGDSGAAIYNMRQQLVGLHMAGSDSASYFCKIEHVCRLLSVTLMEVPR